MKFIPMLISMAFFTSPVIAQDKENHITCESTFTLSSKTFAEIELEECEQQLRMCASSGEIRVKGPTFGSKMYREGGLLGPREVDYYQAQQLLRAPDSVNTESDFDFVVRAYYTHFRGEESKDRELSLSITHYSLDHPTVGTYHVIPGRGLNGITLKPGEAVLKVFKNPTGIPISGKYGDEILKQVDVRCTLKG